MTLIKEIDKNRTYKFLKKKLSDSFETKTLNSFAKIIIKNA